MPNRLFFTLRSAVRFIATTATLALVIAVLHLPSLLGGPMIT